MQSHTLYFELIKKVMVIIGICALAITTHAQQAGRDIAFLHSGLGARPVAMGEAFTAIANDANAVFWNPAGMVLSRHVDIETMQTKLPTDLNVYYLTGVYQQYPTSDRIEQPESAWGAYWVNATLPDIALSTGNEGVTENPNIDIHPSGYSDYQAHALGVSYAWWLMKNVAAGINVTGVYQTFSGVDDGSGGGVTLTPGLLWLLTHEWAMGVVGRDILNYQQWETGHEEFIIPEVRWGMSYVHKNKWIVSAELRKKLKNTYDPTWHIGAEWTLWDHLALRAGLNDSTATVGCGITIDIFSLHYTYTGHIENNLGDAHRVSLGVGF